MATVQRGTSQPKSEKRVKVSGGTSSEDVSREDVSREDVSREDVSREDVSSEDEGPEEVAFAASRAAALRGAEAALRAASREKELLKEKRRERQLLFQEQKKRRLLPETLLEEFHNVPQKQKRLSAGTAKGEEEKDNKNKKVEVKKPNLQGNCSVTRVKDEAADTLLQQAAMDFVQARLYGPRTRRTTNAALLSLEKKRGAKQGAAITFVNKKWGAKLKDKAEKSNKRFIHKQKLIPS